MPGDDQIPHSQELNRAAHGSHGSTPAAWTAVTLGLIGFVVGGIGLMLSPINMVVFWVGVALNVVAGVAFVVMARLGYNGSS